MAINKAVCLWVYPWGQENDLSQGNAAQRSDSSCAAASRVLGERQTPNQQDWVEWGGPVFVTSS